MTKPGRNAPCHCGSGRKYKKCCLPKDNEEARVAHAAAEAQQLKEAEQQKGEEEDCRQGDSAPANERRSPFHGGNKSRGKRDRSGSSSVPPGWSRRGSGHR